MWLAVDMTGGATVKSTPSVEGVGVISLAACTIFRLWISAALRKHKASQNVGDMFHTSTNNVTRIIFIVVQCTVDSKLLVSNSCGVCAAIRALCRTNLLPVTHALVDTWMLTVKAVYKLKCI